MAASGTDGGGCNDNSNRRIFRHAAALRTHAALLSDPALVAPPTWTADDNARLLQLAGAAMESWGRQQGGGTTTVEQHGGAGWASLLNKRHLKEEVEESVVAVAPLVLWLDKTTTARRATAAAAVGEVDGKDEDGEDDATSVTVVDVCCGKGICSILLSYLCGLAISSDYKAAAFRRISKIVMLDRETSARIDWGHIHEANKTAGAEGRPAIEIWEGCDLHETDAMYDRFEAIPTNLALVGIHLCRHLSPACVGLANALGPNKVQFLCLAPCCLPRQARRKKKRKTNDDGGDEGGIVINVPLYEEPKARKLRVEAMRLRENTRGRGIVRDAVCFLCQSPRHFVRACPQLSAEAEERAAILQAAAKEAPCWKCGRQGHAKRECPLRDADAPRRPRFVPPPTAQLDCSPAIDAGDDKFAVYCQLLSTMVQGYDSVRLVDAPLSKKGNHEERDAHHWNSGRKSKFIVVER